MESVEENTQNLLRDLKQGKLKKNSGMTEI